MLDLQTTTRQIRFHYQEAVKCWRTTIYHAWWCGKHLRKMKEALGHGRWLPWVRNKANFGGCPKTATNWMRLNKRYKEPPEDTAYITVRDALESLTTGKKGSHNKPSPEDLVRGKLLKLLLADAWKDWTQEEINKLAIDLEWESEDSVELECLFASAMNWLRKAIKRRMREQELDVTRRMKFTPLVLLQPRQHRPNPNRPSQNRRYAQASPGNPSRQRFNGQSRLDVVDPPEVDL